jgi:cytochrome c oxidase subunit 2
VLPGRYTTLWFQATRVGQYHLFCSQYCGTNHARMGGWIHVMEPAAYEQWLSGRSSVASMSSAGAQLFARLGCGDCHKADDGLRGPSLAGLYGTRITLEDGESLIADDAYIGESILVPAARLTRGFPPLMPTFAGQVSEEDLFQLIVYVKSLAGAERVSR